uniref:Uncharacterized protein n=1 Tax=Arundo donax TaxID=35708 RepID=A0A0A9C1K6_ARUDO
MLQRLRGQKLRHAKAEGVRDHALTQIKPMLSVKKVWRPKKNKEPIIVDDEMHMDDDSPLIKVGAPPNEGMDIYEVFILPSDFRAVK